MLRLCILYNSATYIQRKATHHRTSSFAVASNWWEKECVQSKSSLRWYKMFYLMASILQLCAVMPYTFKPYFLKLRCHCHIRFALCVLLLSTVRRRGHTMLNSSCLLLHIYTYSGERNFRATGDSLTRWVRKCCVTGANLQACSSQKQKQEG